MRRQNTPYVKHLDIEDTDNPKYISESSISLACINLCVRNEGLANRK